MADNPTVLQPGPTAPAIEGPAKQSWYGIKGVGQPPATTPDEALRRDPRKNPVNPKLPNR